MLTGRCTADPHKTVYKQNHTREQNKLQLCALFIVAATPRSSGFFGVFLLGRTFVTLPLYSLPVAPHFALFLGLGGTSLVAPQSLRGVSPGDVVGGKQAWTPPRGLFLRGRASIAVWGPCSGLIWGRKAGSERDRGLVSNSASPPHLFCDSRERPSPLGACVPPCKPDFPPVRKGLQFSPLLWSLRNSESNVCRVLFYVETTLF